MCRWESYKCLEALASLIKHYPDLRRLFVDRLGVKDAGAFDLVNELRKVAIQAGCVKNIKPILQCLNTMVKKNQQGDIQQALMHLRPTSFLPVRKTAVNMRRCEDNDWLIADEDTLRKSFDGRVFLLDFSTKVCKALDPLLKRLGLGEKLLSRRVQKTFSFTSTPKLDYDRTKWLRLKSPAIAR
jgi:hypothetical protein